jgi:transcription initiation factor IIE alpha subunit
MMYNKDGWINHSSKGGEMSDKYKDRFSNAERELSEKSAFVCESCNTKYSKSDAEKKGTTCCGRTMTELLQQGFGP